MSTTIKSVPLVQRHGPNTLGRDFVVGDVHGCFDLLAGMMAEVDFDTESDRLFSVGDLVDRGPKSLDVIEWLEQPWFHAVRGNHEQLAIDGAQGIVAMAERHVVNGGIWLYRLPLGERLMIAAILDDLPLAIEVETPLGLVGIVHAEPGYDWPEFFARLAHNPGRADLNTALWGRGRIRTKDKTPITGVDRVYVGHTPVKHAVSLGNVYYIDTGSCFPEMAKLTMVNLMDGTALEAFMPADLTPMLED